MKSYPPLFILLSILSLIIFVDQVLYSSPSLSLRVSIFVGPYEVVTSFVDMTWNHRFFLTSPQLMTVLRSSSSPSSLSSGNNTSFPSSWSLESNSSSSSSVGLGLGLEITRFPLGFFKLDTRPVQESSSSGNAMFWRSRFDFDCLELDGCWSTISYKWNEIYMLRWCENNWIGENHGVWYPHPSPSYSKNDKLTLINMLWMKGN